MFGKKSSIRGGGGGEWQKSIFFNFFRTFIYRSDLVTAWPNKHQHQ